MMISKYRNEYFAIFLPSSQNVVSSTLSMLQKETDGDELIKQAGRSKKSLCYQMLYCLRYNQSPLPFPFRNL